MKWRDPNGVVLSGPATWLLCAAVIVALATICVLGG